MPVYYFDINEAGVVQRDEVGLDLPDLERAISEARRTAAELMREAALRGVDNSTIEIIIRDHDERPVRVAISVRMDDNDQPG